MPVLLTVIPTNGAPWHHLLWEDAPAYEIGRAVGSDIWIGEIQVSRRHARIEHRGSEGWWVVDHGSANGVVMSGERVETARLQRISELRIADLVCRAVVLTRDELQHLHQERLETFRRELRESRAHSEHEATAVLDRLLRSCARVCGASRGFVLLGETADRLEIRATLNPDGASAAGRPGFGGSTSVVEKVLATGEPIVTADASQDAFLVGQESIETNHIRCVICLPLHDPKGQLGVLYLDSREPGKVFDALDLEFLESLAGHAALALRVHTLRAELEQVRHRAQGRRRFAPAGVKGSLAEALGSFAAAMR